MKLELWYPVKNPKRLTQKFGENLVPLYKELGMSGHNGEDIIGAYSQLVRAAHNGKVVYAGVDGKEGYGVVIRTNEPREYKDGEVYFKTIYWHLLSTIPVKVGQQVKVGDVVGYADTTGYAFGSHLHFGLKPQTQGENDWTWVNFEQNNGYFGAIDPAPYWNGNYAEDAKQWFSTLAQIAKQLNEIVEILKGRR